METIMKVLTYLILIVLAIIVFFTGRHDSRMERTYLDNAVKNAAEIGVEELNANSKVPDLSLAVLPFGLDMPNMHFADYINQQPEHYGGYVMQQVANALSKSRFKVFDRKSNPGWDALIKELELQHGAIGYINPDTIKNFNINGVEAVVYGALRDEWFKKDTYGVKIFMNIVKVDTAQNLWGTTVSGYYKLTPYELYVKYVVECKIYILAFLGILLVIRFVFDFIKAAMTPR